MPLYFDWREGRPPRNKDNMRKAQTTKPDKEMLPEYDFTGGVRGKYAARFAQGTNIVILSPEMAKLFPSSREVEVALRKYVEHRRKSGKGTVG